MALQMLVTAKASTAFSLSTALSNATRRVHNPARAAAILSAPTGSNILVQHSRHPPDACNMGHLHQQRRSKSMSSTAAAYIESNHQRNTAYDDDRTHRYGIYDKSSDSSAASQGREPIGAAAVKAGRRRAGARRRNLGYRVSSYPIDLSCSSPNPHKLQTPTLEVAKSMPLSCREMDNTSLLCLAALDIREARAEVLRRHIMCRDEVDYERARQKFAEIEEFNREGMLFHTVPYKFGFGLATTAALISIPLCFHLPSVEYFNEHYVTADVPEPKDLETWLEVGSWAWNWMEPPLGQISFMILCMQFARGRLENIGVKTYGAQIKQKRADRLVQAYPQYDAQILSAYSKSVSYY